MGPLHTPVADVAVTALTHFDTVGSATAIGEQPVKGLVDPACGARMAVGEALTNLVFARISDLKVRKRIPSIKSLKPFYCSIQYQLHHMKKPEMCLYIIPIV